MKKPLLLILIVIIASCAFAPVCQANSAEPPSILIIVPNAPDDLKISIENKETIRTDKATDSYFTYYSGSLKAAEYTVKVTTGDRSFEIKLGAPPKSYNNVYTLDLNGQTLTPGKSLSRSISLISLRVILTLLIEAVVFFIFGYRKKRSWLIFVIVNLVTQAILNIWLNIHITPIYNSIYLFFSLIFGEILVFAAEMLVFLIFVNEHKRRRTTLYVITANLLSLILGGYLITALPI